MMPLRFASVPLFVLLAAATSACGPATPSPDAPAPSTTAEPAPTSSPTAAPAAAPSAAVLSPITQALTATMLVPARLVALPVIQIEQVSGSSDERARAIFTPVREPIQKQCSPGSSGALKVKVKSEDVGVKMSVEPGSSLTGPMRRCILEALSTIGVDDLHAHPNTSARPTGFSSLITVSW